MVAQLKLLIARLKHDRFGASSVLRRIRGDDKPIAGTRLIREYQGVEHSVTVLHDGFE